MRTRWMGVAAAALVVVVMGAAGTQAVEGSRHSPVVDAVKKTRNGIVTVKVEKQGNWGRREIVGTGVIVDERGYVVTNHHVVGGADKLTVVLADGTETSAHVEADDPGHDLAILKLPDGRKYQEIAFGPGSDIMVGEDVIAIGHPYGYTNTVSTGIVSALGREITMPTGETLTNLIQTSASINPGNSGGPLFNIKGELIGINVALREGAQGIAFALNADTVQQVLSVHLSAGRMAHVSHGLTCHEAVLDEEGPARQQVVIDEVGAKSPAAAAGLKKGDVLMKLAGHGVTNRFDVERALWDLKAGDKVDAVVQRGGDKDKDSLTVSLKLTRGEGQTVAAAMPPAEVKYGDFVNAVAAEKGATAPAKNQK